MQGSSLSFKLSFLFFVQLSFSQNKVHGGLQNALPSARKQSLSTLTWKRSTASYRSSAVCKVSPVKHDAMNHLSKCGDNYVKGWFGKQPCLCAVGVVWSPHISGFLLFSRKVMQDAYSNGNFLISLSNSEFVACAWALNIGFFLFFVYERNSTASFLEAQRFPSFSLWRMKMHQQVFRGRPARCVTLFVREFCNVGFFARSVFWCVTPLSLCFRSVVTRDTDGGRFTSVKITFVRSLSVLFHQPM